MDRPEPGLNPEATFGLSTKSENQEKNRELSNEQGPPLGLQVSSQKF